MSDFLTLQVECYADCHGEETPRRFRIGSRNIEVSEVFDRWLSPSYCYFKLLCDDGTYILQHDVIGNRWNLILFEAYRLTMRKLISQATLQSSNIVS